MKCHQAMNALSAYVDGEAGVLKAQSVRSHLRACAACAARHDELLALRARIRSEAPRHAAPESLRGRVQATLDAVRAASPAPPPRGRATGWRWGWAGGGALAGSAATILAWFLGTAVLDWRASQDLAVEAVSAHVRATLGEQLVQVPSSDRHTVKPWLSARLDYSPPVRDFAREGFALAGGRIDVLDGHRVATLVYRYRDHTIDVYVRPAGAHAPGTGVRTVRGFNVVQATGSGMDWVGVSDVGVDVLASFMREVATQSALPEAVP